MLNISSRNIQSLQQLLKNRGIMSVAFWSIKLANGAKEEVQPPEGYVLNVQQVAITGKDKTHAVLKVSTTSVEGEKLEAVLCTLRVGTVDQANLSLVFGYDVPASFSCSGSGELHVSGYYQPGPMEDDDDEFNDDGMMYDDDEDDDSDEEDDDEDGDMNEAAKIKSAEAAIAKLGAANKKSLAVIGQGKNMKSKVAESSDSSSSEGEDEEDSEDDDDDDEEERIDTSFVNKMIKKHGIKADPVASESEDEEEEEDSEEEEEPPVKVVKTTPKGTLTASGQKQKQKQQNKPTVPPPSSSKSPAVSGNKASTTSAPSGATGSGKKNKRKR